ncbi:MAG: DEAD/DEAH box helicase, partial [Desulfuromonadaceae bacterium]|nr:DEAD/DEAH box helicase [Desulfuromonadaceae bacterium]
MFSPEFSALGVAPELLAALYDLEYQHPSAIQEQSIPLLLEGKNLLGTAQTGTGKTAAYALPLLQRLTPRTDKRPQVLVVTPTRELAIQVAQAMESFARKLKCSIIPIYGGSAMVPQLKRLSAGIDVVVGTPGRLIDHIQRRSLDLSGIEAIVLDEADEMLRMGFIDDVETILAAAPPQCQRALFSATMPRQIKRVADKYLGDAQHVQISTPTTTLDQIEQYHVLLHSGQKVEVLKRLLEVEEITAAMVFVRTKEATTEIAAQLSSAGYKAAALNGDLSQQMREQCIHRLKQAQIDIVVA